MYDMGEVNWMVLLMQLCTDIHGQTRQLAKLDTYGIFGAAKITAKLDTPRPLKLLRILWYKRVGNL